MPLPSNFTTTFIPGTACMGDSRETINVNFSTLLSAVSSAWNYTDTVSSQQTQTIANYLSTTNILISGLAVSSNNVFNNTTTLINCVSALAITVNGTTLYLPLLSSFN